MRLGYNTNGFAHHRLPEALEVIAELGYRAVAITLDVHHLDPYATDHAAELRRTAEVCRGLDLVAVVETGARFLLDARRKHQPTLLSTSEAERARRVDFLYRAIDAAAALGGIVSLWSGASEGEDADARLAAGLRAVCERAAARGVVVAFEPEPGMHVEDLAGFARVRELVDHPALRLTLDVGHAHLTEAAGAAATVRTWAAAIANVHLEGMRRGVHDHLAPWDGDLDVVGVVGALRDVGYTGPACFELSRHSHDAVRTARRALEHVTSRAS